MEDDDRYYPDDQIPTLEGVDSNSLPAALRSLQMFDDPYLSMQATNLGIVDEFITDLEVKVAREIFLDDADLSLMPFLNAQSQMWMFSAYELLRTWRARANEPHRLLKENRVQARLFELRKDEGFKHFGRLARANQIERAINDPVVLQKIEEDLRLTHVLYKQLDFIRVALAKHEVKGARGSVAYAPGYARVDKWTGSLQYQLEAGQIILGTLTRRQVADGIRAFIDRSDIPTPESLIGFDNFMKAREVPDQLKARARS